MLRPNPVLARIVLFYSLVVIGTLVIIHTFGPNAYPGTLLWYLPDDGAVSIFLLLFTSWLMTRFIDKRPFNSLGMNFHRSTILFVIIGLLIGIISKAISLYFIVYVRAGGIPALPFLAIPSSGWSSVDIGYVLLRSSPEELLHRGYLLQTLISGFGSITGLLLSSLTFGIGHIWNGWNHVVTASIFGLLLGTLTIRTGTLWTAIGCHWGANLIGSEIGLKVSKGTSSFEPSLLSFNNPLHWAIFGLITMIIIILPLPVEGKGKVLWERYVQRPAWPPWNRRRSINKDES